MPGKAKRSAVYVLFDGAPGGQQLVCGPYFSVEIIQGQLAALDRQDYHVVRLASLEADGWHVHDGQGHEAVVYRSAVVCSRPPRTNRGPDRPLERGG
jgi:hypothetical protein